MNQLSELLMRMMPQAGAINEESEPEQSEGDEIEGQLKANVRDSDNSSEESEGIEPTTIFEDFEFKGKLTGIQKAKLLKLKDEIYQKSVLEDHYDPLADIINSEFFNGLSPELKMKFRDLNAHIFKK